MTDEATANKELLAEVLTVPSAGLPPLMSQITLGSGTDLAGSAVWAGTGREGQTGEQA